MSVPLATSSEASVNPAIGAPIRVPELSYFIPAHNEEANLAPLVAEALAALPAIAERFEIVIVDDGSRDATPSIADALAADHPDVVRAVHHRVNRGYGGALRSGFASSRFDVIAFTDGDRQFRVADLGGLTARLLEPDAPDGVVGYRLRRADPPVRIAYARTYRLANRLLFGLRVRDVDCACKVFRREALQGIRVSSQGAFFTAELLIRLTASGRRLAEVGVPHYPREAGSPTGARPSVVFRAMRDFWSLRLALWASRSRAFGRGGALLDERDPGPLAHRPSAQPTSPDWGVEESEVAVAES